MQLLAYEVCGGSESCVARQKGVDTSVLTPFCVLQIENLYGSCHYVSELEILYATACNACIAEVQNPAWRKNTQEPV